MTTKTMGCLHRRLFLTVILGLAILVIHGQDANASESPPAVDSAAQTVAMDGTIQQHGEDWCNDRIQKEIQATCIPQIDSLKRSLEETKQLVQVAAETERSMTLTVNDLRSKLATAEEMSRQNEAKLVQSTEQRGALETRIGEVESERDSLKEKLASLETLETRVGEVESERDSLREKVTSLEALETRVGEVETERNSLKKKLTSLEARYGEVEAERNSLKANVSSLETSLESAKKEKVKAEKKFAKDVEAAEKRATEEQTKKASERIAKAVEDTEKRLREEASTRLKKERARKEELLAAKAQLEKDFGGVKGRLQTTKDLLFQARQDLYQSNEKLREFERRHNWILEIVSTVRETITLALVWGQEMLEPLHVAAQPLYAAAKPYCDEIAVRSAPAVEFLKERWAEAKIHLNAAAGFVAVLWEEICLNAPIFWGELVDFWSPRIADFVKQVKLAWKEANDYASPHVSKALKQIDEHTAGPLKQVREAAEDLWGQFMDMTKDHRKQAKDALEPYWEKIPWQKIPSLEQIRDVFVNTLRSATELLIAYLKLQEMPQFLINATQLVNENSEKVVQYALYTIMVLFLYRLYLYIFGSTKKKETTAQASKKVKFVQPKKK